MDDVRGGWARCCFVCRRAAAPHWLAATDGRLVAWVCEECARREDVLRAAQGALGFFYPGGGLAFSPRGAPVELRRRG